MSHPKEVWKFKLWTDAMVRGAKVGDPEYKAKLSASRKTRGTSSRKTSKRRRKKKNRKNRRTKKNG